MLVRTTRTVSALTLRALFYAGLFVVVALVHVAITTALRSAGWAGGAALLASGAVVLGVVLVLVNAADFLAERRAAARELERVRQGLPSGPCCVIWSSAAGEAEEAMPWRPVGALRARYPETARRLGVEGVALLEFEINAQGKAKGIHCRDVWPSDVFYHAAREALERAQFEPKGDVHVRFGASFRTPFVFRIAGAAGRRDRGLRARRPHGLGQLWKTPRRYPQNAAPPR